MSLTAEQLIDHLTIALLNTDDQGDVTLPATTVHYIAAKLRQLVGDDTLVARSVRMHLTPKESRLFTLLAAQPGVVVPVGLMMEEARIRTEESLWVHKRRLLTKLERYHQGRIDCVRGRGYMYVEGDHATSA
jgi:DNA-binding response OmpR family regulator